MDRHTRTAFLSRTAHTSTTRLCLSSVVSAYPGTSQYRGLETPDTGVRMLPRCFIDAILSVIAEMLACR